MIRIIFFFFVTSICLGQDNLGTIILEKFDYIDQTQFDSIAKTLHYKAGDQIKVYVIFKINELGDIVNVKAKSVHQLFEKEAIRIINELPRMVPDKYIGEKSKDFALPLIFVVKDDKENDNIIRK